MFVLPVSGTPVAFRAPTGHDEVLLAENGGGGPGMRVEVVRRLAQPTAAGRDWMSLPYVDVDAALLGLRQFLDGDRLVAEIRCDACGAPGDLTLSVADYLASNRPRGRADDRTPVPTVDRVLAAVDEHGPGAAAAAALEAAYFGRCGRGEARQAMSRLQRIAPPLIGPVEGVCPQCASAVSAWFDPGAFVIAELGRRAVTIFEDVHLLASHYGWSEDAVLSLPRARRAAYVALIAAGSGAS